MAHVGTPARDAAGPLAPAARAERVGGVTLRYEREAKAGGERTTGVKRRRAGMGLGKEMRGGEGKGE